MTGSDFLVELAEYENSEEFMLDCSFLIDEYKQAGIPVPSDEEIRAEARVDYLAHLQAVRTCRREGHLWQETNLDAENGRNDLECDRCGLIQHIQW